MSKVKLGRTRLAVTAIAVVVAVGLSVPAHAEAQAAEPTPIPTISASAKATPTPTPTTTPSPSASAAPTLAPATPAATAPTPVPAASNTAAPVPTNSPTSSSDVSPSPTPTASAGIPSAPVSDGSGARVAAAPAKGIITGHISVPSSLRKEYPAGYIEIRAYPVERGGAGYRTSTTSIPNIFDYRLDLAPGDYKLLFLARGGLPVVDQWWGGGSTYAEGATVTAVSGSGHVTAGIDITMAASPLATAGGKVTLPGEMSLANNPTRAQIIIPSSGKVIREEVVQADGKWTAPYLTPGSYWVRFVTNNPRVFAAWWSGSDSGSRTAVTLAPQEVRSDLNVVMTKYSSIRGRVIMPAGVTLPAGQIKVDVFSSTNSRDVVASAIVQANTGFYIDGLRAGTYRVRFSSTTVPIKTQWWSTGTSHATGGDLTLAASEQRNWVNVTLAKK